MALYGTYLICMPNTLYAYGPVNQALLLDFNFDSSFSQELYLKYQQLFYKTVIRFFLIGCHKFKLLHTFDKSNISFDRSET